MKNITSFAADPKKMITGIAVAFVCVFVVIYAWFQVANNVSSGIETEPAVFVETNAQIDAQAFIFRDETVIPRNYEGTVVTLVSDSQRVSSGQKIANVFGSDGAASLQDEINRLQRKLDVFDKSVVETEYFVADIDSVNSDIKNTFDEIYDSVSDGSLSLSIDLAKDLLVKLNRKNLIVSSQNGYDSEYDALLKEKTELENRINSVSSAVYAPASGYFYGDVDGYENIFKISKLNDLTISSLEGIADSTLDEQLVNTSAGKIVNDFVWYTVCRISASQLAGVEEGNYYKVRFPDSQDKTITMQAERIIKETSSADAVVVFRVNTVPSDFNFSRTQRAQILLGDVSGLAVPADALRVIDGEKGVYVLVGDVVEFRRTYLLDERDGYYIVSTDAKDYALPEGVEAEGVLLCDRLSLYDNVIVSGKNLFNGKIVG